jgi:predicted acetyltransferase
MSPRPMRPPALHYRVARRTDVDTLAELALRAYRVSSLEARREFFTEHPRFTIRDVRVGELDGELVSLLVLYPLQAWVRGHLVPVTGIGSVGVSPEHRRRGVAEALLRATLRDMRQRGDGLSMLYAFRSDFYRKFGWSLVERTHMLAVPPTALPASGDLRQVRRMRAPDRRAVMELYDRHVRRTGHFALARSPQWWDKRLWNFEGEWIVFEGRRRGQIEGYLQVQVDAGDGWWKLVLTVNEFVAETPAAHRALWGYLNAQRDQTAEVVACVPADSLWLSQLSDAINLRGEMKLGVHRTAGHLGYGAMLRVVDVKTALEALPLAPHARGEVTLEVDDPQLPQNSRAWRVTARDGRLQVRGEKSARGGRALPRLSLSVEMLAGLVAGSLSPVRAAEGGLIEDTRGAAEMVEPWFRGRPAFVYPMNAF